MEKKIKTHCLTINGKKLHYQTERTLPEWNEMCELCGTDELWDISAEDFLTLAIEPDGQMVYWLINGRFYETMLVHLTND